MSLIDKINQKKEIIISELNDWAESFNPENILYNKNRIEEEEELEMFQTYNSICQLINRFEKNECDEMDYENILFHIEQINYDETVIDL